MAKSVYLYIIIILLRVYDVRPCDALKCSRTIYILWYGATVANVLVIFLISIIHLCRVFVLLLLLFSLSSRAVAVDYYFVSIISLRYNNIYNIIM